MTTFLRRSPAPFTFRWKWMAALALAALADWLFFEQPTGWTQGLFTAAVLGAFLIFNPRVLDQPAGKITAFLLLGQALIMIEAPNWLSSLLTLAGFTTLALLTFGAMPNHAFRWLRQAWVYAVSGWFRPWRDFHGVARWKKKYPHACRLNAQWLIPLVLSLVFIGLFAEANPLIQQWVELLDWALIWEIFKPARLFFLGFMFLGLWAMLRPYRWMPLHQGVEWMAGRAPQWKKALTDVDVLKGSLILFNLLFLVQTGMDIAYLWGGLSLPEGMTYAAYAHRGAYPLIVTALLAGAFVLLSLRPGSETAKSPLVRWLVSLWILQNVFLTVSSVMRTLLYIEVYSLTHWRAAAIIWMALVGFGLLLVLWRILRNRDNRWLVNANALTLLVVLYGCSVVDFDGMIARYNVQHSQEVTGQGTSLDAWYLQSASGVEAIPALQAYRRQGDLHPTRVAEILTIEQRLTDELKLDLAQWRSWTWRSQRLLNEVRANQAAMSAPERTLPLPPALEEQNR